MPVLSKGKVVVGSQVCCDKVQFFADLGDLPPSGTADTLYIINNNSQYIWNGTSYETIMVQSVTGTAVDNTDPANPVINTPSNLIFYSTSAPSGILTYNKLVTSLDDPDYDTPAVNVPIGPITSTGQLVGALVSEAGILSGNPGTINISTIGEIRRVSGTGTAEFYFQVYQRNSLGVETLICTSNNTSPVSSPIYQEFDAAGLFNNGTWTPTDRVVVKYYATRIPGGSNPSYEFLFGGTNPVRTLFPVSASLLLNVPIAVGVTTVTGGTPGSILTVGPTGLLDEETLSLTTTGTTGAATLTGTAFNVPQYQGQLTLTTTGSSGAATLITDTINIPNYSLSGLGGVPTTRQLTINGYTQDLSANRTWSVGTVTSVSQLTLTTTGTDITSTVATGTTTPVITLNVPTASATNRGALSSADWTTFNAKQSAITLTTTGTSGAATFIGNTLNIPQYQGTLTFDNTPTNGSTNPVTSDGVFDALATKQDVLTNPVTGTGTSGQVAYFNGTSSVTGSSGLVYDAVNQRIGIGGIAAPLSALSINSVATIATGIQLNNAGSIGSIFGDGTSMNIRAGSTSGISINSSSASLQNTAGGTGTFRIDLQTLTTAPIFSFLSDGDTGIGRNAADTLTFFSGGERARFDSSGNFVIGTTTSSARLHVQGSGTTSSTTALLVQNSTPAELFRILDNGNVGIGVSSPSVPLEVKGTTTTDGGQLGAELLTSSNWTTTGWAGDFVNGFSHNTGNTDVLSNTLAAVVNTYYQITWTVTNRTAGTFVLAFGGYTSGNLSTTGNIGPRATTTGNLTITPTSTFDGTIIISIKVVTAGTATFRLQSSAGTITNEVRSFTTNTNTAVGLNAGSRITTGGSNSFFGREAGSNNTTGGSNSFFGVSAGSNNTTGIFNSFFGQQAGSNNTTGGSNSFFGVFAGRLIANGSNLTVANNSVFLGYDTRAAADSQTNQTVIGYSAVGLGSNTTVIGNSSTTLTWLGGSTSIGTTDSSARLHVRGSGTTSSTTALLVQNGTPSALLSVRDDGVLNFGSSATPVQIFPFSAAFNTPLVDQRNLQFFSNVTTQSAVAGAFYFTGLDFSQTANNQILVNIGKGFAPTSGTATFSNIVSSPTINQTGGANGITRGLYVNPTLTAAADWRSIEWSNNTGWGLYGAGTAGNYLAGNTSIGTTTNSARLHVRGSGTTSSTTALLVQNSTPAALLQIYDNGRIDQTIPSSTNTTIFGTAAGSASLTGSGNTFIGTSAGNATTTGANNSAFGFSSGLATTTGSNNVFFGSSAGRGNVDGSRNIFIGNSAGRYITDGTTANTKPDDSVFIGTDTKALGNNQTNQIVIGYQAIGLGSNTTVIGNSSTTHTWLGGDLTLGTTTSSARLTVRGADAGNTNNAIVAEDSTGLDLFTVRNDGAFAFAGGTVGIAETGYLTMTNLTPDRDASIIDASAADVNKLANLVGTLIEDLKAKGIILG